MKKIFVVFAVAIAFLCVGCVHVGRHTSIPSTGYGLRALGPYRVTVDYHMTLRQMVAAGGYDSVVPSINAKYFAIGHRGVSRVNIMLVNFGRDMLTAEILRKLDARGLRPANLAELLALGAERPEMQRQFRITALGSVTRFKWSFGRRVPSLGRYNRTRRCLFLSFYDGGWGSFHWFAAVRK